VAATRRLAAIMFTDLQGFTQDTHRDEAGALQLLEEQEELIGTTLAVHRGRKIKSMGDGTLVEFPNALDALQCAVDLQRSVHERNTQEGAHPLRLRVGIHLGDVQEKGTDIFGDAVNIASRIEPLAEEGGVCFSVQVFDQVHNKVPYQLEKLGPRNLKGIREPIEVYRVVLPWTAKEVPAKGPVVPRLAVLPLDSISPDPKDEYFADGLTEELISVLSQLRGLRVVAHTSVKQYKSTPKPVAQIGTELGASKILEGSVRKAGIRLRISLQLIDTATQEHLWAETYDRELEDIFAVQAEVASRVAEVLKVRVQEGEAARLAGSRTVDPESYVAYLKGRKAVLDSLSEKSLNEAREQFERAVSLDPQNARAYAGLAEVTHSLAIFYHTAERTRVEPSHQFASRAIEIDPNLAEAHSALGHFLYNGALTKGEWSAAENEAKIALSLNPSYSQARLWYASLLAEEVRPQEALRELRLAEEADPQSKTVVGYHVGLLLYLQKLDEAKQALDRLAQLDPGGHEYHEGLAYYYAQRSDFESAVREVLRAEELPHGDGYRGTSFARAIIYALAGQTEMARGLLKELSGRRETQETLQGRAMTLALLGDLDECFRVLETMWERRQIPFHFWRLSPLAEPVRKDPRFAQLLKKSGL